MNFSPYAYPYNGDRSDVFADADVLKIMAKYKVFLLHVFDAANRTLLCSQAVQAQLMAMIGGKEE